MNNAMRSAALSVESSVCTELPCKRQVAGIRCEKLPEMIFIEGRLAGRHFRPIESVHRAATTRKAIRHPGIHGLRGTPADVLTPGEAPSRSRRLGQAGAWSVREVIAQISGRHQLERHPHKL